MVETTVRTAYSPTFAEGRDFSCGIFDTEGRMVIQSFGIGVHLGSLEGVLAAIRERYPEFTDRSGAGGAVEERRAADAERRSFEPEHQVLGTRCCLQHRVRCRSHELAAVTRPACP